MLNLDRCANAPAVYAERGPVLLADTRMYEQHFGFQGMPFSASPADWQFFESESTQAVLPKVLHALQCAAGVAVVTGPDGVGKTVLAHHLQSNLTRQGQAIILPGTSLQSTDDLYTCIRRNLKTLDGQSVTSGTSRWDVVERLQSSVEFWGPIGLLIDDAHLLNQELFLELQFLLEQRSSSRSLCRLLLVGSHALEETFAQPALSGFSQRIRTFAFLQPLRMAESVAYLRARLDHVGGNINQCFNRDAVETIVEVADGNPRCLDLLSDESLLLTYQSGEHQVTVDLVQTALGSMKHLPHAWNVSLCDDAGEGLDDSATTNSSYHSTANGVIEIGAGSEDDVAELGHSEELSAVEIGPAAGEDPDAADGSVLDSLEELPALDELSTDSWVDGELLADSAAAAEDDSATVEKSAVADRSFDAGYLLADMELVGDPTVGIDEDLDARLLGVADSGRAGKSDSGNIPELATLLPNVRRWKPAGSWPVCWGYGSDVIRLWAELANQSHSKSHDAPLETTEQLAIATYEVSIPPCDEPVPVWPPDASGVAPSWPITVANGTDEVAASCEESQGVNGMVEPVSQEVPIEHAATPVSSDGGTVEPWADGQLLHDLSDETASDIPEQPVEDTDVIPLRLRLVDADNDDDGSHQEHDGESLPGSDRMFTLPVTLDEVSGECRPIVDSVRELKEELETFHGPTGHPSSEAEAEQTVPPLSPVSGPSAMLIQNLQSESSAEDESELQRPRLLQQAQQAISSSAGARRLRAAAGAENTIVPEDARPALAVRSWESDSDVVPLEELSETDQPERQTGLFKDLFTRLRAQR